MDDKWYRSKHYYSLKAAAKDVSLASGAGETFSASAKLVGKSLFNTSIFAGKLSYKTLQELPNAMARDAEKRLKDNPEMPQEKRAKMEEFIKKNKK